MANILIVDSYPVVSSLYCEVLEEYGHSVYTTVSGREALLVALYKTIDIAIVDDRLPDFTADEVLTRLKQHQPHMRGILSISSIFDAAPDADRWDGLVTKSADYTVLEAEVARLAGNSFPPSLISSCIQAYKPCHLSALESENDTSSSETEMPESQRGDRNLKRSSRMNATAGKKG
jgi:CheY-like chemotaxis protein